MLFSSKGFSFVRDFRYLVTSPLQTSQLGVGLRGTKEMSGDTMTMATIVQGTVAEDSTIFTVQGIVAEDNAMITVQGMALSVARGKLQGKRVAHLNTGVLSHESGGGIEVVGSIAYIAGGYGLGIVDVSDPTKPKNLKYVNTGVLSKEGAGSVAVHGATAFVAGGFGLAVVDVSDPRAAKGVASVNTGVLCRNSGGHVLVDASPTQGDGNIVVVQLTKPTSSAPVGVDLVGGGDASSPVVLREVRGLALACGVLQPGDLLLSVNEVWVTNQEAAAALIRAAPDRLVLRFRRPPVSRSDADHPRSARRRVQFFDEGGYEGGYEGGSFGGGDGGDGGGGDGGGGDGGGGE